MSEINTMWEMAKKKPAPEIEGKFVMSKGGKYFASNNPESYSIGPCETIEDAVEDFRSENEGESPSSIGISREVFCRVDGMDVLESLSNGGLYDELYEDALSGWCNFKNNDPKINNLSERLTAVLHAWLDEVGEEKSWAVIEEIEVKK